MQRYDGVRTGEERIGWSTGAVFDHRGNGLRLGPLLPMSVPLLVANPY